ncbi:MAG: amino acid ABC transporter substrate-binding protein [Xanthobacteraceae bacterium]|nr:amino acid ABC transporter substrate-binding protein [Xanthobacteraceae bacterium]
MRVVAKLFVVVGCALLLAQTAVAQDEDAPIVRLSGTLAKVRNAGEIMLGYRADSFPFSYLDRTNHPTGYSLDLCNALIGAVARAINMPSVRPKLTSVTAQGRFAAVMSGEVDLECGVTTDTPEREKRVAFSPTIYVSGTKLMVQRGSGFKSIFDLKGKRLVSIEGTTNEETVKFFNDKRNLGLTLLSVSDRVEGYAMMTEGRADAFAADDVLLYAMIAQREAQRQFIVIGDYLSYDPYGLMFRRDDPQFRDLVQATFRELAGSGDLIEIYHRWFIRRTPTGERLNLPMSPQLQEVWHALGMPE